MRLVMGLLVGAVTLFGQAPDLGSLADRVKDALARENYAAAKKAVQALAAGVEHQEFLTKYRTRLSELPVDGPYRMERLGPAAKAACDARDFAKAEAFAIEMLTWAEAHKGEGGYGDAVYDGNMVVGRVALLRDGNIEEAKARLLAAGKTPGSNVLSSFGPNLTLARDLLARGERDVVVQFFEQCRKFWKASGLNRLEEWTAVVGTCCRMPDFGPNLVY